MRATERIIRDLVGLTDDMAADDERLINELTVYFRLNPGVHQMLIRIVKNNGSLPASIPGYTFRTRSQCGVIAMFTAALEHENLEPEVEEPQLS